MGAIGKIRQGDRYKEALTRMNNQVDEDGIVIEDVGVDEEGIEENADQVENDRGKESAQVAINGWLMTLENPTDRDTLIKDYITEVISWEVCKSNLVKTEPSDKVKKGKPRKGPMNENRRENRNTRKYRRFKFLQQNYHRDKRSTIKKIIDGEFAYENEMQEQPEVEEIEKVYVERLESRMMTDETAHTKGETVLDDYTYGEVREEEVREAVRNTSRDTANGSDDWKMHHIKHLTNLQIAMVFNKWWVSGVPDEEKKCRTIMLHKGGERKDVGNWRPVTIGNVLIRLYAKIWDKRLRKHIILDDRQKAFVPVDGCYENVKILKRIMK